MIELNWIIVSDYYEYIYRCVYVYVIVLCVYMRGKKKKKNEKEEEELGDGFTNIPI